MLDVRGLAAADMWGARGTMRRRRVILAEFVLGALGCTALGAWILVGASGIWIVVGIWLVGLDCGALRGCDRVGHKPRAGTLASG